MPVHNVEVEQLRDLVDNINAELEQMVDMPAGVYDFLVGPDELPQVLALIQQAQGRIEAIEPAVPEREPTGSTFVDEFEMEYEVNNYHPEFAAHLLEQRREHGFDLDAD